MQSFQSLLSTFLIAIAFYLKFYKFLNFNFALLKNFIRTCHLSSKLLKFLFYYMKEKLEYLAVIDYITELCVSK